MYEKETRFALPPANTLAAKSEKILSNNRLKQGLGTAKKMSVQLNEVKLASDTISPIHYDKNDRKKCSKIPGTSYWIEERKAAYIDYIMEKVARAESAGWKSGNFKTAPEKQEEKPTISIAPQTLAKAQTNPNTAAAVASVGASVAKNYVRENAYKYIIRNSSWFSNLPSSAKKEIIKGKYMERLNLELPSSLSNEDKAKIIGRDLKRIYSDDIDESFKSTDKTKSDIENSNHYSDTFKKLKGRKVGAAVGAAMGISTGALIKGKRIPSAITAGIAGAGLGYAGGRALDNNNSFEVSRIKNHISKDNLNKPKRLLEQSYMKHMSK